uniref:Cytochrome P450 n=1 Tax=Glossina austeni TaxID=7395 RepID=A0A1A9UDX4_GLOAU
MSMLTDHILIVCALLCLFIFYAQRKCWLFVWQLKGWRGVIEQPILWLLLVKDEKWKIRRKQLNPTFSHQILLSFFNTFNAVGQEMQQQLSEMLLQTETHRISFEALEDLISRAVLEVSCCKKRNRTKKNYRRIKRRKPLRLIFGTLIEYLVHSIEMRVKLSDLVTCAFCIEITITTMDTTTHFTRSDTEGITRTYRT